MQRIADFHSGLHTDRTLALPSAEHRARDLRGDRHWGCPYSLLISGRLRTPRRNARSGSAPMGAADKGSRATEIRSACAYGREHRPFGIPLPYR